MLLKQWTLTLNTWKVQHYNWRGCTAIPLAFCVIWGHQLWTHAGASVLSNSMPCLVLLECLFTSTRLTYNALNPGNWSHTLDVGRGRLNIRTRRQYVKDSGLLICCSVFLGYLSLEDKNTALLEMSGTTHWYRITSQKTWILNAAAVKTSNTCNHKIHYQPVIHLQELVPVMEVKGAMETSVRSVEAEILSLSAEQRLLLDQQLRKHVQLTTQHFLLTYAHPQLSHFAAECHGIIVSCSGFLFNCCINF
jgi:hypothetical protein